jgi:Uma2 family endonuclease
MPLDVGAESMPEPDLAVVPGTPRDYYASHPTGAALVLEVTDTSQSHDRKRKPRLYAEAGIQDYWIVNLTRDVLEVYRNPVGAAYRTRLVLRRGERIAPLARSDAPIAVADLLPIKPGSTPE